MLHHITLMTQLDISLGQKKPSQIAFSKAPYAFMQPMQKNAW